MQIDHLEYATIEITKRCNFMCRFCFAGSNRATTEPIMITTNHLEHIMSELLAEGVSKVTLTGGEPLMDQDTLIWFFRELARHHIAINLNTNLSLLNSSVLDEYIRCGGKNTYIFTSLLSPDKTTCDYMTGIKGSFEQIVNGINLCHRKGIKLSVNFTLDQENFRDLELIPVFAKQHQLERVSISQVIPPYYNRDGKEYLLLCEQLKAIAETLVSIHEELLIPVASSHPIPLCVVGDDPRYEAIEVEQCRTGTRYLAINLRTGDVFACSQEHRIYGNIFEESLHTCWQRMRPNYGLKLLKPRCRNCGMLNKCGGECIWNGCIDA